MAKKVKKKELGKGIAALLSKMDNAPVAESPSEEVVQELSSFIAMIPVDSVEVNPWQPRSEFDQTALKELSESIKVHGLIQPITVRRLGKNDYQLISGERRLRGAKQAGIAKVPAYIRIANDQEMLEMALVENIQRSDLNAMEVAFTYQRLKEECQLTDQELAKRVAKKRSSVSNYLRLLKLPPDIQQALKAQQITMGHARALVGVDDLALQNVLFKKVVDENLSVRATEHLIAGYQNPKRKNSGKTGKSSPALSTAYREIQDNLCKALDAKVQLKKKGRGKGQIVINFSSDKDLNRLLEMLEGDGF